MRNQYIAVAVAAALAVGHGVAAVAAPTPAQASAAQHKVYVAGSSAAAGGVVSFLETTLCGGAFSIFTTPTSVVNAPDFRAVSCTAATGQPFAGSTVTVWYRPEGGSVVGVLPVFNNTSIKQLDIVNAGCATTATSASTATYSCTNVTGSAANNGTDDTWGGGVLTHNVDIGVSDLEPGVFGNTGLGATNSWAGGGSHDPVGTYNAAFTGADQGVDALQGMTHNIIFQQVFGFVASSNLGITDLPKEQIAAIYDGLVSDWHKVTTSGNTAVTSTAQEIIVCNREIGSGTRAETDIFLNGNGCNGVGAVNTLAEVAGSTPAGFTTVEPADNFQTSAELDCVNSHTNAIGYVSIDNFSKVGSGKTFPNTVALTVSGVTASQKGAAEGVYSEVFEASLNKNTSSSADGTTLYNAVFPALQNVNTTSTSGQIVAIPGLSSNVASAPLQAATSGIVTSDFARGASAGGNSCTPLTHQ